MDFAFEMDGAVRSIQFPTKSTINLPAPLTAERIKDTKRNAGEKYGTYMNNETKDPNTGSVHF